MIVPQRGDMLTSGVEAIVNPVNTVGVMGKGLALAIKHAFPEVVPPYTAACREGTLVVGRVLLVPTARTAPRWVIHFPTKQHWRAPSQMAWIREGLQDLRRVVVAEQVRSVAVPALGCGLGGLPWPPVEDAIRSALGAIPGCDVHLYGPQ